MGDAPLIDIAGLVKHYPGQRPLRIARFTLGRLDRIVLSGLDAGGAEGFVLLVTGASVPDAGDVVVAGRSTRDIATDAEWLRSLDRFGLVTARAVLIEKLPTAANMALPLTLAIDPVSDDVRRRIEALAEEVELPRPRLDAPAGALTAPERVRVHLARALATDPQVLLLERPAEGLDAASADALGRTVRRVAEARGLAWIALSDHRGFARASGGARRRVHPETGALVRDWAFWRRG